MKVTTPVAGHFTFTLEPSDFGTGYTEFLQDLKDQIPKNAREYDFETKVWTIKEAHYGTFRRLRDKYFRPPCHDLFEEGDSAIPQP